MKNTENRKPTHDEIKAMFEAMMKEKVWQDAEKYKDKPRLPTVRPPFFFEEPRRPRVTIHIY